MGGIGIAPGANINYDTGHALFEATHGTAPKYAGQDKVNPGSVILSGEMMLRYMGWNEAADRIIGGIEKTIGQKVVTYDLARLMEGAKEVKCSEFGTAIIKNMETLRAKSADRAMRIGQRSRSSAPATSAPPSPSTRSRRSWATSSWSTSSRAFPRARRSTWPRPGPVHGYDSPPGRHQRLRRDGGLGHRRHHRRPRAQAGHDPRRPPVQERGDRGRGGRAGGRAARRTRS